jgi:hypothetical protein
VNVNELTTGVTAIAAGGDHTCALTSAGGIMCWGGNYNGQLGDGTTTEHLTPVNVSGLASGILAIAAGGNHTCALTSARGVKCWGYNGAGQLGDGTTADRLTPVDVAGQTSGAVAIAVGGAHTCALTSAWSANCWGFNHLGQLGNGIPTFRTTPVDVEWFNRPDFVVTAIEVTQAIQDLNNTVPLIAGKRTYARVHVRNQGAASSALVTARLCKDATCRMPSNPGGQIQILTNPDRARLDQSFYFELPPDWLNGGLTLIATVNPPGAGQVEESDIFNNSMSRSIQFVDEPPLRLRLYNVRYGSDNVRHEADEFHLDAIESWLSRAYPISTLDVSRSVLDYRGTPVAGAIGGSQIWSRLASEKAFNELFGEDSRIIYYGVVDDGGTVIRGIGTPLPNVAAGPTGNPADYPWDPRLSWDTDGSFGDWYAGHEIGHTLGTWHAPCGVDSPPWEHYPYPNGVIGGPVPEPNRYYGFDIDSRAIYTPTWHDMMTYCPFQWISDYNYNRIRTNVPAQVMMTTREKTSTGEYLIVAGSINLTQNTGSLDTLYRIQSAGVSTPPITGTHAVKLLGASDIILAEYPIMPSEDSETQPGEDQLGFISEVVPWITATQRVAIYSGTLELDSRLVSTNTPTVTVLSPNGGEVFPNTAVVSWSASDADLDPLTYVIQYSADDGATWQAIAVGITNTTVYTLDLHLLPGGDHSRVQIIASDGINTGIDASDAAFHVARKLPTVRILSPANDSHYLPGQTIILVGQGTDVEDGTLADSALTWQSNVSGILGTGRMLDITGLRSGKHTISLMATDSTGYTATVSIKIFAGAKVYLPIIRRN